MRFRATIELGGKKEYVRWVEEAKKPETRARRVAKAVDDLRAGRPRHS